MLIFLFKGFMEVNNALLKGRFFWGGNHNISSGKHLRANLWDLLGLATNLRWPIIAEICVLWGE